MNIKLPITVPAEIVAALKRKGCTDYSDLLTVFHCIQLHQDLWVGVAGDGGFAAYEWFVWSDNRLITSNAGYGDTAIALRDVLQKEAV